MIMLALWPIRNDPSLRSLEPLRLARAHNQRQIYVFGKIDDIV